MNTQRIVVPVILSGGVGSRLWPLSRSGYPKPFVPLPDGESLMQKTLQRIAALQSRAPILTVTNRDYYFLTRDAHARCVAQKDEGLCPEVRYLLEPAGRNTAAAMAAAAFWAQAEIGADAVLLFLPADHLIPDRAAFVAAVDRAVTLAEQGFLVTFGVQPTCPETGFGYIRAGEALGSEGFRVERFVEKPDAGAAQRYLDSGEYTWNSGMFCLQAETLLLGLSQHAPEIHQAALLGWQQAQARGDTWELGAGFAAAPDLSIDYALMEHSDAAAVVPVDFIWNDVGAWRAYGELLDSDAADNRIFGGDTLVEDSHGCIVHSPHRLTALLGVEDLLVVDTPDALLIARKDRDQDVKRIVSRLKKQRSHLLDTHVTVHRPWGNYTVLEEDHHFKMKRIVVNPKEKLSLQMHHHRSEHWIVVSGTAEVTVGEEERLIMTNESTFIPAGTKHRLSNPGVIPLVMVEVQSGAYLGEDDIVRFEDVYGRAYPPVTPGIPSETQGSSRPLA